MKTPVSDIAFTPAVKSVQEKQGSRANYARMETGRGWQRAITDDLAAFIADRDSFYLGTASSDGRPYIQHRGGPAGFLKVPRQETQERDDDGDSVQVAGREGNDGDESGEGRNGSDAGPQAGEPDSA